MRRTLAAILALACLPWIFASDVTDIHPPADAIKLVSFNRGDASDRSWLNQTATTSAGVTFPAGYRTADFDGTSSAAITYPDDTAFEAVPLTVCFWARIDTANTLRCNLVGKHVVTTVGASGRGWYIHWSPSFGHGVVFADDGLTKFKARTTGLTAHNDGTWRHLAFTIDSVTSSAGWVAYVNGAAVTFTGADGAGTVTTFANTDPLQVAGLNWQSGSMTRLNGAMDDLRIYNRVLSSAEIGAIYAETIGDARP